VAKRSIASDSASAKANDRRETSRTQKRHAVLTTHIFHIEIVEPGPVMRFIQDARRRHAALQQAGDQPLLDGLRLQTGVAGRLR